MTCVIFIRHGETDWNLEGRWQGQIDVPLNSRGHLQAQSTAANLASAPITAIYASDLERAVETAGYLAEKINLPVHTDARLREIHQGEWQGLKITEIQTHYQSRFQARQDKPLEIAPPGGETVRQVGERVVAFLQDLVARHADETVAVVTHGFVMALVDTLVRRARFEDIWRAIPESGAWQKHCLTMNDVLEVAGRLGDNRGHQHA